MGIETVLDLTDFDRLAAGADLVITGEGRLDSQSLRGKVVIGVGPPGQVPWACPWRRWWVPARRT